MQRAIARVTVGVAGQDPVSQGTGFLVSPTRQVLTALHVVADLKQSRRSRKLMPFAGVGFAPQLVDSERVGATSTPPINLFFGVDDRLWQPAGPVWIVDGLYDLEQDWVVLGFSGAVPADVKHLDLTALTKSLAAKGWKTLGFPANTAGFYEGTFTDWDSEQGEDDLRLTSLQTVGAKLKGISGAPCVTEDQVVGIIYEASLRDGASVGGQLAALPSPVVGKATRGRLPFDDQDPVPFEVPALTALDGIRPEAIDLAGKLLGLPPDRWHFNPVVRGLVLAGVSRAAKIFTAIGKARTGADLLPMVGAARLHHQAVALLAGAFSSHKPSAVQSSDPRLLGWYTDRACHELSELMLSDRILQVPVAKHLDEVTAKPGESALEAKVARALEMFREAADARIAKVVDETDQADLAAFWDSALAGDQVSAFCVALHDLTDGVVAEALAARLPNAHVLMVSKDPLNLDEAALERVVTIAPHLDDEKTLMNEFRSALRSLQRK